jgi:integrase
VRFEETGIDYRFVDLCRRWGYVEEPQWRGRLVVSSLGGGHVGRWSRSALSRRCRERSSTATGRRNFAIVMILARLGLRAAEVGALELEDVDWRGGELVVRGKARRDDPLPLPADVGEAIAAYLTDGRPETPCRAVFVTRFAPLRALAPQSVSKIVYDASRRAGFMPRSTTTPSGSSPSCGPRLWRRRRCRHDDLLRTSPG